MRFTILCTSAVLALASTIAAAAPNDARQPSGTQPQAAPLANPAPMATVVSEGFDDITTLSAAGWTLANLSTPVGSIANWFQGNSAEVFPAYDGAANAYIAANYNFVAGANTINGWLVTPAIAFGRDAQFSFHTRKVATDTFPDRLEVRLCTAMPCTNLGSGPADPGDFSQLLYSVNPNLVTGVYPTSWTQFQLGVADGLPRSGQGRIALRYFVSNGGPSGSNSDYIGIDRVVVDDGGAPAYFVGGTVTGLAGGSVQLVVTGGETLEVAANGSFGFTTLFDQGAQYSVTVVQQPGTPPQVCSVANGNGTIAGADVGNLAVACETLRDVSGSVSGLAGSGLVLQLNGGNDLAVAADGPYAFSDLLLDGEAYAVTVAAQPAAPNQSCVVAGSPGTVAGDVTGVDVSCTTLQYPVGGVASNVLGSGLALQLNGGGDLAVSGDGPFQFGTPLDDGSAYTVTVSAQPTGPNQTCSASNATGALAGAAITDVAVACVTEQYQVGGTVTGLQGSGLVLQLNGGNDLAVAADGSFAFPQGLDDGSAYAVTISAQPGSPVQTCSVADGTGTLAGADVTAVAITCATDTFAIGGTVAGLAGSGLLLQLNGGQDLAIAADGAFTFPAPLADGSAYAVTVAAQPASPAQTCTVSGGTGTLAGANVATVAVACADDLFPVSGVVTGLTVPGLVLTLNGGAGLPVDADGSFSFLPGLAEGQAFLVEIAVEPAGLVCTVSGGSGTVGAGEVTGIAVACGSALPPALAQPALIPASDRWALLLLGMLALVAGVAAVRRQG